MSSGSLDNGRESPYPSLMRTAAALALLLLAAASARATDPETQTAPAPADPNASGQAVNQERIEKVKSYAPQGGDPLNLTPELQQQLTQLPDHKFDKVTTILGRMQGRGKNVDQDNVELAMRFADGRRFRDPTGDGLGDGIRGGLHGERGGYGPGGHEDRHIERGDPTASLRGSPEAKWDPNTLRDVPPSHKAYGDAQTGLGVQAQLRGDDRGAYSHYQNALNSGQTDPRTLTFASLSALNAGEPEKAANWSAWALKQDPKGPLAEQATAINKMAENRMPRQDEVRRPLTSADAAGAAAPKPPAGARAADTIPELDRPLPPRPTEPGLPKEALAVVAEANRLVAQAAKAYRAGDIKEAAAKAVEALAKDPDDVRALQVHASAMAKEGRWEEVKRDADRALDLAPGYVPMLLLRAAASVHAKDWRAVRRDADEVLTKEGANPTAWRFRGIAQAGLGERTQAIASLERARQHGDPEAARLLAVARSLPPGADVVDLVDMLTGGAEGRAALESARPEPSRAPAKRSGKSLFIFGAAALAGLTAGGMILLAGWSSGRD